MNEKIVQTKSCKHCSASFDITDKDLEFYDKVSPVFNGKKYSIPTPTLCPECRQQRRLSWQNMYNLYYRKCKATDRKIISIFSEDKDYIVYNLETWWGDSWDPKPYDFNFNTSITTQFDKLLKTTPIPGLFANFKEDENSDFTNFAGFDKNCYMIFHADFNEDCYYATGLKNSKKCVDSLNVFDCENMYECINCQKSYGLKYSQDCINCSESWFLKDCNGSKKCFMCTGLQNKSYNIFNEQKTQDEYEDFMKNIKSGNTGKMEKLISNFLDFKKDKINKAFHGLKNENYSGEHIFNSKNVTYSFDIQGGRDMKFCERIYNGPNENCYDVDQFGAQISRIYECSVIGVEYDSVISTVISYNATNVYYSMFTFNCKNCFGCVGLKNKSYCILNKQYTKEEYNTLVPKIIEHMKQTGEWGEFFPSSISPFGYNETVAQEYFPLSPPSNFPLTGEGQNKSKMIQFNSPPAREGLREGCIFNWSTYEAPAPSVEKIIPASKLPDSISDIPDDILNWAIECEVTKKPFRIIAQELEFYRKHNLPIPKRHPDQRHLDRMKLRNPRKLFDRDCDKCSKSMKTTYSPEREEIVYCEECYNNEVY